MQRRKMVFSILELLHSQYLPEFYEVINLNVITPQQETPPEEEITLTYITPSTETPPEEEITLTYITPSTETPPEEDITITIT